MPKTVSCSCIRWKVAVLSVKSFRNASASLAVDKVLYSNTVGAAATGVFSTLPKRSNWSLFPKRVGCAGAAAAFGAGAACSLVISSGEVVE